MLKNTLKGNGMDTMVMIIAAITMTVLIVAVFFYCLTLYRTLQATSKNLHQFPAWFVWLFLIPYVGLVFQWMMLPFGIPNTLKKAVNNRQDAVRDTTILLRLGLGQVIITTLGLFIRIPEAMYPLAALELILWIWYWVKILSFKKQYLNVSSN